MSYYIVGFDKKGEPVTAKMWNTFIGALPGGGKTTLVLSCLYRMMEDDPSLKVLLLDSRENTRDFKGIGRKIPLFFQDTMEMDSFEWKDFFEDITGFNLKKEFPHLDRIVTDAHTLEDIAQAAVDLEANTKIGIIKDIAHTIGAAAKKMVKERNKYKFSSTLDLKPGFNVMDIHSLSRHMQRLVGSHALRACFKIPNTVPVLDEGWKLLPQAEGSPAKAPALDIIRQGRTTNNFIIITSQDIAKTDKEPIGLCDPWLLGFQRAENAIDDCWKNMPSKEGIRKDTVSSLDDGWFMVSSRKSTKICYVWPYYLPKEIAIKIARGELSMTVARKYEKDRGQFLTESNVEEEEEITTVSEMDSPLIQERLNKLDEKHRQLEQVVATWQLSGRN